MNRTFDFAAVRKDSSGNRLDKKERKSRNPYPKQQNHSVGTIECASVYNYPHSSFGDNQGTLIEMEPVENHHDDLLLI